MGISNADADPDYSSGCLFVSHFQPHLLNQIRLLSTPKVLTAFRPPVL